MKHSFTLRTLSLAMAAMLTLPFAHAADSASPATVSEAVVSPQADLFADLVSRSLGVSLPAFGQELFSNTGSALAATSAPGDYVLGAGDEVVVKVWGGIDLEHRGTINNEGNLFLPKVGEVFLAGTRYEDLRVKMAGALSKLYKGVEFSASLGQLKAVQVFVVGHVAKPGSFVMPPFATSLSALMSAGGPTAKGSLRQVQVKRGGKTVAELDLYELLLSGNKAGDVRIQAGDVVHVPAAGPRVALSGAVNTPAIFEMRQGDSLASVLRYASGLSVTARTDTASVERIEQGKRRKVATVSLAEPATVHLNDGDVVIVPRISNEFVNAVTLRGAVANPMRKPFADGMRVSALIGSKDELIVSSYWDKRNSDVVRARAPGSEAQLKNDVQRAYEEINWDYAVIERLDRETLQSKLLPFNLGRALAREAEHDVQLQAGDVVTIFSKKDIKVPMAQASRFVRIEGEVARPGVYQINAGDTLRDVVQRAGGLTPDAYLYGASFTRDSVREQQQKRMQEAVERLAQAVETEVANAAQNALSPEDAAGAKAQAEAERNVVKRLAQVKASGRIVLEVPPAQVSLAGVDALPAIALEDSDRLVIPSRPSTVAVVGQVYNESAYLFNSAKTVGDYLKQAGGVLPGVKGKYLYVARADGSIARADESDRVQPGDTVVALDDVSKKSFAKSLKDWTQIFYQFGLGAAGINNILR